MRLLPVTGRHLHLILIMSKFLESFLRSRLFLFTPPIRHILKERLGQSKSMGLGEAFVQDERELRKSIGASRGNIYRLERFGKAMMGTASWEVPGAVLNGQSQSWLFRSSFYLLVFNSFSRCMQASTGVRYRPEALLWMWEVVLDPRPCRSQMSLSTMG